MMISSRAARPEKGQSAIEFACGLAVLIPIMLCAMDLCLIYAGVTFNTHVCREATRAAATGPPDAIVRGGPRFRAHTAIALANKSSSFQIDPNCSISEKIISVPLKQLGGPVDGSVTVETTVTVHPPLLEEGFFTKDGLRFKASATCPINYNIAGTQEHIQACPVDDSWQVTIATDRMDHYLAHPGSLIPDVTRLSVFYVNAETITKTIVSDPIHYEDLFYAKQHAIGCNQFHALDTKPNTTGVLRIGTSTDTAAQVDGYAAGNAAGRLFLDLLQRQCIIRQIIAPQAAFSEVIQGMCQSGFYEESDQGKHPPPRAIIQILSDPPGNFECVIY